MADLALAEPVRQALTISASSRPGSRSRRRRQAVRVLDLDPELAEGLAPEASAEARHALIAEAVAVGRGPWAVPAVTHEEFRGHLGLLVLDGLLVRSVGLPGRACAEILGAGDIIRPWESGDPIASLPSALTWTVLEPARLAVLDRRFVGAVCQWPEVVAAIAQRTVHRSHRLAFQLAISHLTRVDARLLAFLWHCADRWGRVMPEGVVVRMRVTHEVLAKLVGAQRPSVTTALRHLSERRLVMRRPDASWLLQGEPPDIEALLGGVPSEAAAGV